MDRAVTNGEPMMNAKPTTTFVHVDTVTFCEVVQRLTGHTNSQTTTVPSSKNDKIPPIVRKAASASKLHERRKYSTKPKLEILKQKFHYTCAHISPSFLAGENPQIPGPVTPSTLFSKLTILEQEQKRESSTVTQEIDIMEEQKVIKQRRFYLHPSPRSRPGFVEPELLNLFPLTSPKTEAGYTTPRIL